MLQNLRLAVRALAQSPGFTLSAFLTLALGIGANTAIFSVVQGVLLRPLPFPDDDTLVALTRVGDVEADLSIPDAVDLRASAASFQDVALYLPFWAFDLTGEGEPERLDGSVVEPRLFELLEAAPILGRVLTVEDDRPGGERVAVISEGLWRRRFGGDPEIVGRTLSLSGNPWTVVGVVPEAADFLDAGIDLWVPAAVETPWALEERGTNNFEAVARLAPAVTLEQARAELETLTRHLAQEHPQTNQGKVLHPRPLKDLLVGDVRPALLVLLGAVGLVLLIVCANLANLMLVRAVGRREEVATRLALGGGRGRIAGQFLVESLVLAAGGGALGCLVAAWGTDLLLLLAPDGLPRSDGIGLHGPVLAFTAAVSLGTGLLFGLMPALQSASSSPAAVLQRGGFRTSPGRRQQRSLGVLVAAEVGLAFLLLVGAGLLARSFLALQRVELGFDPAGVVTVNLVLPEARYGDMEPQTIAFRRMVEAAETLPGVADAAFVIGAPLADFGAIGHSLVFADRPPPPPGETPSARNRPVLGDYFRTLGIPIVAGRGFTDRDDEAAPRVAVVNQAFARRYWPGEDPLGQRLSWRLGEAEPEWMTVVGVARDVKTTTLAGDDDRTVYTPYLQRRAGWQRFGTLVVKGEHGLLPPAPAVRQAIWAADPAVPVPAVDSLARRVEESLGEERFLLTLVAIFAAAALAIALQGIYGVLAYAVAQRRGEIGVRVALGAGASDVVRLVLGRGVALALTGAAAGLATSFAFTRTLAGLLYDTPVTDPATYLVVTVLLLGTALAACLLPARRAARVEPAEVLRDG